MFLVNSRHRHFSATPRSYSPRGVPLLPKLRGYFAEFLNQSSLERLGIFYPPTCVGFRYGLVLLNLGAFLGSVDSTTSELALTDSHISLKKRRICLSLQPRYLHQHPIVGLPILLRPSIAHTTRYGNINPFSIDYGFSPRLRNRLTLGRLPLPRKPWVYGERVFHPFYRYLCQHNHFSILQRTLRFAFSVFRTLPYRSHKCDPEASVPCLAPIHFRRGGTRPVSYYAFFKRWLLLSQLPGCLCAPTTLYTEHGLGDLSCRSGLFPFRLRIFAPAVWLPENISTVFRVW